MSNSSVSSLETGTAKKEDGEKLEKGNSKFLESRDDVKSQNLPKSGNISHLAERTFKLGEKGSGTRPLRALQDYNVLREQCLKTFLKTGELFKDPEFPALQSSIYGSDQTKEAVVWKRPGEIVPDPKFFVRPASHMDVQQNQFADGWFLAALANLAMDRTEGRTLLTQVVPNGQSFDKKDYAGIFHFRFWQYGRWVDVVIDDRLPMYDSDTLLGASSDRRKGFWTALVEKAYAKLHGSYAAIDDGGFHGEAMEDLTGGVAETYYRPFPDNLFDALSNAHSTKALLACTFKGKDDEKGDELQGLIENHAYTITKVALVPIGTKNKKTVQLVRVRNPWGHSEWNGPWSDKSREWKSVSDEQKKELYYSDTNNGEFWMCLEDFKAHLDNLTVCYLNPNSLLEHPGQKEWKVSVFEGEWVSGVTAGTSPENMELFQHNPQYYITLAEECTVMVALRQKNRRDPRRQNIAIGLKMIALKKKPSEEIPKPLDSAYLKENKGDWITMNAYKEDSAPMHEELVWYPENTYRGKLPSGSYCIIPYAYEDGEFILRVLSEKPHKIEEYHEELSDDEVENSNSEFAVEDEAWRNYFLQISGDDRELNCSELNQELIAAIISRRMEDPPSFDISEDACRNMAALLDVDRSGKLSYWEFETFLRDVGNLIDAFGETGSTDDGVGYLSTFDLRKALNKAGLHVNIRILGRLVRRYGSKDHITLENFIICALRIKNMLGTFKNHQDPLKTNVAQFTLDEWIDNNLYL